MDYQRADRIKSKSLLQLIGEKKFGEGQGLGSAIGSSISDKFVAKSTRFKRAFDPLNWVSKLVGQGAFGRFATTAMGRAFGRNDRDIQYFGGYRRKNTNKNPNFTTIGSGRVTPLRSNDGTADVLGKIYNFLRKTSDEKREHDEIERSFRQEMLDEDERRHKDLVNAITKFVGKKGKPVMAAAAAGPGLMDLFNSLLNAIKSLLPSLLAAALPAGFNPNIPKLKEVINEKIGEKPTEKVGEKPTEKVGEKIGEKATEIKPTATKISEAELAKSGLKTNKAGRIIDSKTGRFASKAQIETATKVPKGGAVRGALSAVNKTALNTVEKLLSWLNKIPGIKVLPAGVSLLQDLAEIYKAATDKENPIDAKEAERRAIGALAGAFAGYGGMELGSLIGAAVGTAVLPGWGTIIAGLAGGIGGYYLGDKAGKVLWDLISKTSDEPPVNTEEVNKKLKEMGGTVTEGGAAVFARPVKRRQSNTQPGAAPTTNTQPASQATNTTTTPPVAESKPAQTSPKVTPVAKTVAPVMPLPELNYDVTEPVVQVNNKNTVINGGKDKVLATTTPKQRNTDLNRHVMANASMY